jgi:hypothetical protein
MILEETSHTELFVVLIKGVFNYHFSRIRVSNYQNLSHKGFPSGFDVKSCQNS